MQSFLCLPPASWGIQLYALDSTLQTYLFSLLVHTESHVIHWLKLGPKAEEVEYNHG